MPRDRSKRTSGNGTETHIDDQTARAGIFTNSAGESYAIRGVSPWALDTISSQLADEWKAQGRSKPSAPTYEVETAGGDKETHEHNETTLDNDESRAAWAGYQQDLADWEAQERERYLRNILMDGVVIGLPDDESWVARHRFMGRRVPDDPLEREMYWKKTTIIKSGNDAADIMTAVLALTGVSEEKIRIAEDSFRSEVEKPDGPEADRAAAPSG